MSDELPNHLDPTPSFDAPPASPAHRVWRGLGIAASGDFVSVDWECFRTAALLDGVKLLTNMPVVDIARRFIDGSGPGRRFDPKGIVVRLHATPHQAPHQTGQQVFNDHRQVIGELLALGVDTFELHNEPNVAADGWKSVHWSSASQFVAEWYTPLARAMRREFPAARLIFPGLTPSFGEDDPGRSVFEWFPHIHRAIRDGLVDGVGVHCYWPDATAMRDKHDGLYFLHFIEQNFGQPLWITEFSNNKAKSEEDDAAKGREYRQYFDLLRAQPQVMGAYAFALRSDEREFNDRRETWARAGAVTDIARQLV
ncbi:MAG TPA: glycosyl hydrolase [Anaerolineae bacterium]|nr:glycosyl hydrolase [Anaerolineae bacterium]